MHSQHLGIISAQLNTPVGKICRDAPLTLKVDICAGDVQPGIAIGG